MTKTLAVEWGRKYGIRVNAIAPGPIERTGGADKLWISEEMAKRTIQSVPLGRLGTPEEIAGLAYYLCSDEGVHKWNLHDNGWRTTFTSISILKG